jgi:uncharacterized protein YgiM (DUF1202 family)
MRYRILILAILSILALSACNLSSSDDATATPESQPLESPTGVQPAGRPSVTIVSPQNGSSVVVNQPIILSVNATDTVGVTRVQLFVNDQIVRTSSSASPEGDMNWTQVFDYTPRDQGTITLRVVAYRGSVSSDPFQITVTVNPTQVRPTATIPPAVDAIPTINPYDYTCRVQVVVAALNFRTGPSLDYAVIQRLGYGDVVPIIGRLPDNTWLKLRYGGVTEGWVFAELVTVYGNCDNVPALQGPATATPTGQAIVPTNTSAPATATSIPATAIPTEPPLPNLTITNIDGPANLVIASGETTVTERYSVNITNMGGALDDQFSTVALVLPGGTQFDLGVVANLSAGQSISLSTDVTFDTTGALVLQFTVDSNLQITESSELDNSVVLNVNVTSN